MDRFPDALDGALDSNYDRSRSRVIGATKNEIVANTKTLEAGISPRIRRDRHCESQSRFEAEVVNRTARVDLGSGEARSSASLRNTSYSHHSALSNNGYSRKIDGGFYNR
ncbi:MAG: hypothetical protein MHMPM18_002219 [Marteilia pararefringens]